MRQPKITLDNWYRYLYNELRNGNEEAIALIESKEYRKAGGGNWVVNWWFKVGKAKYLAEEERIQIVETLRDKIESGGIK